MSIPAVLVRQFITFAAGPWREIPGRHAIRTKVPIARRPENTVGVVRGFQNITPVASRLLVELTKRPPPCVQAGIRRSYGIRKGAAKGITK